MKKILFITNGHGEDLVAAEIIKQLGGACSCAAFPLVGEGKAFENLGIQVLGARRSLPGGGFSLRNFWFLIKDISSGLLGSTINNLGWLKNLRGRFDLTVAVGDIVPIIGARLVKAPFIFIGVNKSDHYKWFGFNYTPWEKWLLKKYARKIFVRDHLTRDNLERQGIPAEYVGNPLMDCFEKITNNRSQITNKSQLSNLKTIGFLPGTRSDAKLNLDDFEKVAAELVNLKDPDTEFKFLVAASLPGSPEFMQKKPFSEVLAEADLVVGLSGTGNEQAAGSGIPVISFYGRGSQYNKKFARAQKQLLGESLGLVKTNDPKTVAAAVWQVLKSPDTMARMGQAGRERMGESGAVARIVSFILGYNIQKSF